jgi:hypothetical protein
LLLLSIFAFSGLRVEWAKARARALRWKEEVILLEEEMRRAIHFSRTMAARWHSKKAQSHCLGLVPDHVLEGTRAYAIEQAETEELRANTWAAAWVDIRTKAKEVLKKALNEEEEDVDLSEIVIPDIDSLDVDLMY